MNGKKLTVLILLAILISACYHPKGFRRIGVLIWSEGLKGYRQAHQGIMDGLRDNGYREGLNIEIDYRSAEGSDVPAGKIIDDFVGKKYDLIVAIGSAACLTALEGTKESKTPVVFSVVTSPKAAGVIEDWASSGKNITGVSIDIPAELFFEKLKKILPGAKNIGIVYMDKYQTAIAAAKQAGEAAPKFGLTPHMIILKEDDLDEMQEVIKSLPLKMDAVYIAGDPTLYAEAVMEKLNPAFKEAGIPSILISENYLKYGALFALNGDFYKIGRQTVPHILKVFDDVNPRDIPSEKPYDVRFTINKKTADDLNIGLEWNIIIEANSIVE